MIAELGHFSLILALALALCLALLPAYGVWRRDIVLMSLGPSLATGIFVFTGLSFICLAEAFLADDFTVAYVASNSNSALPDRYKLSAIWGAHEGSFLLWTLVMTGWTLAVATFSRTLPLDMKARVLAIMGCLTAGFLLFLLFTSNPFLRHLPISPREGADLNPLLQDFGLIVHPPMLYMGYVGLAVPFSFAIATLTSGRLDAAWARWSRPWTNAAWAFLTVGITLGSWWAYYELGWGGWWFWDAVENASFMPWLVATALIHSLAASEKRGVFRSWTVLLAIFAFSFSLLGAFLVRSGVLTSVHAFAVDPERGFFILAFLVIVIGGSLLLYALKASGIRSDAGFTFSGRETLLLVNNVVLVVAVAAVLLGTIYPLIYEAATGGSKISVGPPYFNLVFVPLMVPLFIVMALSPASRWRNTPLPAWLAAQRLPLALAVSGAVLVSLVTLTVDVAVLLFTFLSLWILTSLAMDVWRRLRHKRERLTALFNLPASYVGMLVGHLGIAVAVLGVTVTLTFSSEEDVRLEPGDVVRIAGYDLRFDGVSVAEGPNYLADRGELVLLRDGVELKRLYPEKRLYKARGNVMTEAAIDGGLMRDIYVALGEPVGENAWAVRVHYKPMVRWIWGGGVLVAIGGFVTLLDRRYRRQRVRNPVATGAAA